MTDETYRTVAGRGEAAFAVRGSEFVGYVAPTATVADAEAFVAAVAERHPDATHDVPAYRVRATHAPAERDPASTERDAPGGTDGGGTGGGHLLREWSSDDGEPAGSAGKPALNVLQQRDLENVAAVVVRYYGGTNLGVGGLARAYSRAVTESVDDAGAVEAEPHERFDVAVEYDDSGTVRGILESAGVEFDANYGERVTFEVRAPLADAAALRDRLRSATSDRAEIDSDVGGRSG